MKKVVKLTLLVIWLCVIFFFSSQNGEDSSSLSTGLLLEIVNFLKISNPSEFLIKYGGVFRKLAHFIEYLILGVLVSINIESYKDTKRTTLVIILCMLYATSDEAHQLLVPDRVFSVKDILLDSFGSSIGTLFCTLVYKCYQEKKH